MLMNRRAIQVEWGDCDPAGIVYFPRFFEYFDASTGALFEKAGLRKAEMLRTYGLVGIPLIEAAAQFYVPARFGETVEVESRVVEWGTSSFRVEHKLYKGSELAAEGRERRVWTVRDPERPSGLRSEPVPQEVKDRFR